jgi:hypothetical protein
MSDCSYAGGHRTRARDMFVFSSRRLGAYRNPPDLETRLTLERSMLLEFCAPSLLVGAFATTCSAGTPNGGQVDSSSRAVPSGSRRCTLPPHSDSE